MAHVLRLDRTRRPARIVSPPTRLFVPMPTITTIKRVDDELCVAVSEEMLKHRRLKEGDRVHVIESSNGILIVPFDDDFEEAMQLYDEGAEAYDDLLHQFSN